MTLNKAQKKVVDRLGAENCLRAYRLSEEGNGCSTVGFTLGCHWKTASAAIDIGRQLMAEVDEWEKPLTANQRKLLNS